MMSDKKKVDTYMVNKKMRASHCEHVRVVDMIHLILSSSS